MFFLLYLTTYCANATVNVETRLLQFGRRLSAIARLLSNYVIRTSIEGRQQVTSDGLARHIQSTHLGRWCQTMASDTARYTE